MKHISQLSKDLTLWLERGHQRACEKIADKVLQDAANHAPKDTRFLMSEGKAFVKGKERQKVGSVAPSRDQESLTPLGGYTDDVTIVFRAGRRGFDYSYYVGVKNPSVLKDASTIDWINTAFDRLIIGPLINEAMRETRW